MPTPIPVTREAVKRLAVIKQGLHQRPPASDSAALKRIITRIGLLQLDSISVVARSHYLVMLARAGLYDPAALDELLDSGFLFETWAHAMCQLPSAHYAYFQPYIAQKRLKESQWHVKLLGAEADAIIADVLNAIRERGPMSSKDFESQRRRAGGWWNWKPAKIALETLFDRGELMVSHRINFQRYYDLPERVLGHEARAESKSLDDYQRWTIESGLRHIGIGTANQVADYYRQYKRDSARILADMLKSGQALPARVEGWKDPAYIHREDLPRLEQIQASQPGPGLTVFLTPFDNLFWDRQRDLALWDFFYRIEVYTPKAKRVHGYYVMPILHGFELVGRIDPKIDRKRKRLILNNLHLERGLKITGALNRGLISAIKEFMAFHDCDSFELRQCNRAPVERRLRKVFG